jgi:hypothetical protein
MIMHLTQKPVKRIVFHMENGRKLSKAERWLLYGFLVLATLSGIFYMWTDISDLLRK